MYGMPTTPPSTPIYIFLHINTTHWKKRRFLMSTKYVSVTVTQNMFLERIFGVSENYIFVLLSHKFTLLLK